jgi:hypothetical protein
MPEAAADAAGSFRDVCGRVRFKLDTPAGQQPPSPQRVAGFIAEVRSESLQVGPTTSPLVWRTVMRAAEALDLRVEPEVYVKASPELNAYVPGVSGHERPIIVLHSAIVSLCNPAELGFVIGHELGHLGLGHTHRPYVVATNELDALRERAQSRARELSCDRVGLLVTRSTLVAASQMIKSASGLSAELLGFDTAAFVAQLEGDLPDDLMAHSTHPTMPFRLWALLRFSRSDVYLEIAGLGGRGVPLADVDREIQERLALLGDGRMTRIEDQALESALTWAAVLVVLNDGIVEDAEREALTSLIGADRSLRALRFADQFGMQGVRGKFDESFHSVVEAGDAARVRFYESLAAFALTLGLDPVETTALLI